MDKLSLKGFEIYSRSLKEHGDSQVCMARGPQGDVLLVFGDRLGFQGDEQGTEPVLVAPLNEANARRLRELFPFTAPRQGLSGGCSFGVGDRLGIASPGHLLVFERWHQVFPVLAQQSIRELKLTGRSYEEVLSAASFAVFKAGFTRGFGADGDHLKTVEEIAYALDCGFSMITLDCSEHIRNDVSSLSREQVLAAQAGNLDAGYLGRVFTLEGGLALQFDEEALARASLIYDGAIAFIDEIYQGFIKDRPVDFEISIDETATPTSPLEHFYVASELHRRGIRCQSLAPRFCGSSKKALTISGTWPSLRKK